MQPSLQGYFLIAAPTLTDSNFFRSVVLILQHDTNGALGLILNRPLRATIGEAWNQISDIPYDNDSVLFQGGPCESPLMVLHRTEVAGKIEVLPGIYFTAEAEDMKTLVHENASPTKFFIGSSGWTTGQLESEITAGDWIVMPAIAEHIFSLPEDQWLNLTRLIGRMMIVPNVAARLIPPDPSVN